MVEAHLAKLEELRHKQAACVSDEALEELEFPSQLLALAFTSEQ